MGIADMLNKKGVAEVELETGSAVVEDDFLAEYAGVGTEKITEDALSRAFLSISQAQDVLKGKATQMGLFRNSLTDKIYGSEVRAIVLSYTPVWDVKEVVNGQRTGQTVRTVPVGSIGTTVKLENGRPQKYSIEDDNQPVDELYAYIVLLADHPEEGLLFFKPSPSSKRILKKLNKMFTLNLLSNGAVAPTFANVYKFTAGDTVQRGTTNKFGVLLNVEKEERIDPDFLKSAIKPRLEAIKNINITMIQAPAEESPAEDTF